jgi:5'-nucleotidase
MSEKIALIDMDGTVCDYTGAINEQLRLLASPGEKDPIYGDGPEQRAYISRRRSLVKGTPGFWRNLKPIKDGFHVVNRMRKIGFNLNILTKGPERSTNAWTEKVEWCQKHIPEATVTITQDKGLVYGRILFDDYPPYVTRWLEWRPRGQVIMLEHEWNKDFDNPNVFKYKRLDPSSTEWQVQDEMLKGILTAAYERP